MPRGSHNLRLTDTDVNRIFQRNHRAEEREYYAPDRSYLGSSLSPDCRPALARRMRVDGELI